MTPDPSPPDVASRAAFATVAAEPPPAPPQGRPTVYTAEIALLICDRLCDGETLNVICEAADMPASRTVRRWAADPEHPFSPQYARAREIGYHKMADDLIDVADDGRNDFMMKRKDGGETFLAADTEHIARSKLRVDTRKWFLSKALPKLYGDKVQVTGEAGGPIQTVSKIELVIIDPKAVEPPA